MRRIFPFLLATLLCSGVAGSAVPPRILFLTGEPTHGWNEHEFPQGARVLAQCLEAAVPGLEAEVVLGWPEDDADARLLAADVVVLYSDGEALHIAHGQSPALRRAWKAGTGLAVLHYSLDTDDPDLSRLFLEATGGTFEVGWSVNPIWTAESTIIMPHPITRGVESFTLKDEWYFHMRFPKGLRGVDPLLLVHPPMDTLTSKDGPRSGNPAVRAALEAGVPQVLAWATETADGRRGFATTGGHYLHSWNQDDFRTLVLNGILWAAGGEIPQAGLPSTVRGLVEHENLGKAIALGDTADIRRHLERDPAQLNAPIRGSYTPLHMAILRKQADSAIALLEAGADPNIPTGSDQTALHLAVDRDLPGVVPLLIDRGVDLSPLDNQGWTALHLAAAKDRLEIARMLIDAGADPNARSAAGGTPLHEAAPSASVAMVRLLLDAGSDPAVVSDMGVTALDLAREYENEAVAGLLRKL